MVVPLKDKKSVNIVNAFQNILDDSKRKPNKILVDKGSEFYNRSMKSWLEKNDIEMYSTHNEGKSDVAERFIITLKTKIYKYMTSILKNVYIDKLHDIVDEYNNTYHKTIKMKPVDVKSSNYFECNVNSNDKDSKFQVGHNVRISKYKKFLLKDIPQNGLKIFLWLKKLKTLFHWHISLVVLMVKKLLEHFMKKNFKKQIKKNLG